MVSSIIPGATGAGALGVDPRYARTPNTPPQPANESSARGDRVDIGDAARWAAARESVRSGLAQLGDALAAGRDAFALLNKVAGIAGSSDGKQDDLSAALDELQKRVDAAIAQGATVLAGNDLSIQAEPGAPDLVVQGVDLRLKDAPKPGDAILVPRNADLSNPQALAQAAQRSLDAVQTAMQRFVDAARALDAHQGFLGAAESAMGGGVRSDLDADSARLMALQVRQGLDAASGASIANVEPQAVLSLFKA